ncbi:MAG: FimB/Mfa2 family fimbrial subunit [Phocaeicola sp.]
MKALATTKYISIGALCALLFGLLLISCDSIEGDDLESCPVEYRVKFKYDRNMKYADAFAHEVNAVAIFAFNDAGDLVYLQSESGENLAVEGYEMKVEFDPREYHLIVWGGLISEASFYMPVASNIGMKNAQLTCKLDRKHRGTEAYQDQDLTPLFHGLVAKQGASKSTSTTVVVPLTKNTNNVRVVLQQLTGDLDPNQFVFQITDNNGWLNYTNLLLADETLTYEAWRVDGGTASLNSASRSGNNVAIAELTVGRLMKESNSVLVISTLEGEVVLSIPLIQFALMVKGYYNQGMEDQEYLDRQDEYNFTFFLDSNQKWINSSIVINGWQVVLNETDLN